ncbi:MULTISPECIES: recombinase [Brucella]|uniref:recombinase n=1 Tax=Brucella TaxID=234 RepID=UPI0039B3FFC7
MPTLTRILLLLAVIAAIIYGAMFSLATFVKPTTHEITIEIPSSKLKQTVIAPPTQPAPVVEDNTDAQE